MKNQAMHSGAQGRRAHTRPGGFTLVEILVVLAIIAILAGILFPVFRTAQESGRSASCQSNLKQLGLAFTLYTQDTAGRLPGAGNWQNWGDGFPGGDAAQATGGMRGGHWVAGKNGKVPGDGKDGALAALGEVEGDYPATGRSIAVEQGALFSYAKSANLYICPSNEDGDTKKLTYGMNCALSGAPANRVRLPSSMVLLVDEWRATDGYFWAVGVPDKGNSTDTITPDHNATGNLLFLDGHVKNYTNSSFPLGNNEKDTQSAVNKGAGSTRKNEPVNNDTPRFHDVALGPNGSTYPSAFHGATDSCILDPTSTTTPPVTPPVVPPKG